MMATAYLVLTGQAKGLVYIHMIVDLHHTSLRLLTQQCEITTIIQSLAAIITQTTIKNWTILLLLNERRQWLKSESL